MSITPMEYSSVEMKKVAELEEKQKISQLNRKGSYGITDDDGRSGSDNKIGTKIFSQFTQTIQEIKRTKNKNIIVRIVENIYFQIFITLLTMVSLFLYDIKTIFLHKEQDFSVGVVSIIFFFIFMTEICMNIKTEGYFCSFFFFLDLISTITLLLDVDFITDSLFNSSGGSNFQVSSLVARSKASRVAARGVRVIKIFRLARVAKLYKSTQKARQLNQKNMKDILQRQNIRIVEQAKKQGSHEVVFSSQKQNLGSKNQMTKHVLQSNVQRYEMEKDAIKQKQERYDGKQNNQIDYTHREGQKTVIINERIKQLKFAKEESGQYRKQDNQQQDIHDLLGRQSNISKMLSEDTIKKIVIIILLIMITIPLMDISNYITVTTQWDYMTNFVVSLLQNGDISVDIVNGLINLNMQKFQSQDVYSDILCIDTPFDQISPCSVVDFLNYRTSDLGVFYQNFNVTEVLQRRTDLSVKNQLLSEQSADSIVVFVNYQRYNRIDSSFSMITTVFVCLTIIYLLTSFNNNIGKLIITPIQKMLNLVKSSQYKEDPQTEKEQNQEYQTQMVQQSIIKIKMLMETIFGPIGNQLVQEKLLNNKPIAVSLAESEKKSFCVFGLCKISHLSKITEQLNEDIFGFFNQISNLVHNAVYRYGGYCTKILDDGFLLVFKVSNKICIQNCIEEDFDPLQVAECKQTDENTYINILCDFSLFSMLKILARICKQPKILKYRNDQRLLINFGGVFNIEMKFAMNIGWAYEGVVGSSYKIDPLFLGQKLIHLQKLIKFGKNIKNSIIVSQALYANMSPVMQSYCRGLDIIKFGQIQVQQNIYIVDFDIANVTASRNRGQKIKKQSRELKIKKQMNLIYLSSSEISKYNASTFVSSKKELREILKRNMNDEIRKKYNTAFQLYKKGNWQLSQQLLEYQKLRNDPISQRLYQFMRMFNFKAGDNWKNYRDYSSCF